MEIERIREEEGKTDELEKSRKNKRGERKREKGSTIDRKTNGFMLPVQKSTSFTDDKFDNAGMSNSSSSKGLITRSSDSIVTIQPTTTTDVHSPKKKKAFREVFGYSPRLRIPDDCAFKFFQLSKVLGHKNNGHTLAWLLKQAELAVDEVIGASEEILETDYSPETNIYVKVGGRGKLNMHNFWRKYNVNHIWALWDDLDGMPRLYARIDKIFHKEMKVEVALLEPQPTTQEETIWLVKKNLPIACGTFKEATLTSVVDISAFSHEIDCKKVHASRQSFYKISPKKGEIWAVFKDWDLKWTLHDLMSHSRYEIVEVVSDLCKKSPVSVICLTKVEGFEAVFSRPLHKGLKVHQQFSAEGLLRFSHCIPASKLTGKEMDGVPSGSWKLDSAAVPLKLL